MARVRATGLNRGTLSFLGSLGRAPEASEDDDRAGGYQPATNFGALGALGDTAPSITGIDAVDKILYKVSDSLDNLNTALTITTVASTVAALCGLALLFRTRD